MAYTTLHRDSKNSTFKPEDDKYVRDASSDNEEYRPPLPARPAPSSDRGFQQEVQQHPSPSSTMRYDRSQETVMAYMVPLPRPLRDGVPVPQDQVPQRYMLYMPPSPDLLKVPKDKGKERKRDKAVRLWQQEVKKAKTYNGSLVSFRGMESASIRGAVWALNFVKPSDVTFLSRIPRKSIRSLNLNYPEQPGGGEGGERDDYDYECFAGDSSSSIRTKKESPEDMYDGVKEELNRSKKRTRRDFFIGTALLPVTTAIDIVIPVFGGLSEVNIVWMVLNATGWATANKITGRLVLANSNNKQQQQQQQQRRHDEDDMYTAGGDFRVDANRNAAQVSEEKEEEEEEEAAARGSKKKQKKKEKQKIEMGFSPCPAMAPMAQYVQAACHKYNPEAFPQPTYSPDEAEVLVSIGWTPERRGREDINEEDDVAVSPV